MEHKYTGLEIAVIGIGLKFPNSNTPDEFWDNLIHKKNLVQEFDSKELENMGVEETTYKKTNFVNKGINLADKTFFDNQFFGYTAKEAKLMDPQTRIYHECVWAALEDAGINPLESKDRIGIFSTASYNFDRMAKLAAETADAAGDYMKLQLGLHDVSSTLISNKLNLKGPAMNVNTACSSSLTAIHLAARNLLLGECTVAIAGGVKINENTNYGYLHQEGMINSNDGYCRPFDDESSGTIGGEGAGVVILKKMQHAIKDGDHIYCVIKGSSVNNDGNRKHSYSSPSESGQVECITAALAVAKVDPNSIGYIEAHGTGTKIGDPIEIKAILKSYNKEESETCYIGSVKSNFGHLDRAAGVIGFIKTALCLKKKKIPATLHFKKKNQLVDFDFLQVPTETVDFKSADASAPLRAAISSFGIGGTNVHAILEEYKEDKVRQSPTEEQERLFVFSAKNEEALTENIKKFNVFLDTNRPNLADVSWTLKQGRAPFNRRAYFVSSSHEDLQQQLAAYSTKKGDSNQGDQTIQIANGTDSLNLQSLSNQALGKLWVNGKTVNWEVITTENPGRKISLPTYSFVKNDFTWNPISKMESVQKNNPVTLKKQYSKGKENKDLTEFESKLLTIFQNFFEDTTIGIADDFFELGGDSLSVVSLNSEITKEFKINLLSQDVFEATDIKSLAKLVETELWNLQTDDDLEEETTTIII